MRLRLASLSSACFNDGRGCGRPMMTILPVYLRYALFAAIATGANLASQAIALRLYQGWMALTAAIAVGTGIGLVTKYVLDKHWIFFDRSTGAAAHAHKFALYTATGILTTAVFWGFEYSFDAFTPDGRWRYLGAVIGLTIGYVTKYRLDRHFVFNSPAALSVSSTETTRSSISAR